MACPFFVPSLLSEGGRGLTAHVVSSSFLQLKEEGGAREIAPIICAVKPLPVIAFLVFLEFLVFSPCEDFLVSFERFALLFQSF